MTIRFLLPVLCIAWSSFALAQNADSSSHSLRVFLNCQGCYSDFLRTQVTWVDFGQDQYVADVDVLVTTITTGSGGTGYSLYFTGIFNEIRILRPTHSLNIGASFTQTWGTLSTGLSSSVFLDDWQKYSYGSWFNFDIRVFKGLSVSSYFNFNVVRDQVNIRRQSASDEEILLQQKELLTNYNFYTSLGLSYRFGSIYNNVVNPRFTY